MFTARKLAQLVMLLACLAAAIAVSQAKAANRPQLMKQCKVMSFNDIASVIGPLQTRMAGELPTFLTARQVWTCNAQSQQYHVWITAFCNVDPRFVKQEFHLYSINYKYGKYGLTWKFVKGFGDQAVFSTVTHDANTGGVSTGFIVRRGSDIIGVVGAEGMKGMAAAPLARLTHLALKYDCR